MLKIFQLCEILIWMLGSAIMVTAAGKTAVDYVGTQNGGAGAAAYQMALLLFLTIAVILGLRKAAKHLVDIVRIPYLQKKRSNGF